MIKRGLTLVFVLLAVAAPWSPARARGEQWQPVPARYGIGRTHNVPVTMSDWTVLRVDVYYPTDPATGKPAAGPFPVLLQQTPYSKTGVSYSSSFSAPNPGLGAQPYLIQRGYINVVADVRGTGASHGTWGLLDPIQGADGATLVRWAARLAHSNGRVGLYGPSYMGLIQFMTARALGPRSPLRAMFPIVAGNDAYRDVVTMGGIPDVEFSAPYIGFLGALNMAAPVYEDPTDPVDTVQVMGDHARGLVSAQVALPLSIATGGELAYEEGYWRARATRAMLDEVVANGIPTYMVGGWFDLFQRGSPLNYSGLQNAYAGRPVEAPMLPRQPATGRYQLLMGPWYHLTAGEGVDIQRTMLAWFDRWLKDRETGIDRTDTPLHLFLLGADRWVDVSHYPIDRLRPATFYLAEGPSGSGAPSTNDGRLSLKPSGSSAGSDRMVWTGASSPCSEETEQWGAGGGAVLLQSARLPPDRCTLDDRSVQFGPGALTYTSDPMRKDVVIGGPIDVTVFATSTRPEVELEAILEDVSPDGRSMPLTSGALLGSFRGVDRDLSWLAKGGRPLLPYHPYTRASATPVPVGEVTRFDIEVYPTFAEIAAGHRLRLTLVSSDTPHLLPIPEQLSNLIGGVYQVQRTATAPSFLEVPMAPASVFAAGRP